MKKNGLMILLFALFGVLSVSAQIRGNSIRVDVVPDHQDWRYEVGQTAQFKIMITRENTLLNNVTIEYEAGPEMYPEVKKQGVMLKDGTLTLKGKMTKPGFYRVDVKTTIDGKEYKGACSAAFSPELLQPTTVMPRDFNDYWQNAIREARQVPLNPTKRLLPERCTNEVNVYEVSFQNMQWNFRTYGILCVPVKEGKYPALLRVPGAGVRPYGGDIWTASQGAITLEIGIHGIPVTMDITSVSSSVAYVLSTILNSIPHGMVNNWLSQGPAKVVFCRWPQRVSTSALPVMPQSMLHSATILPR